MDGILNIDKPAGKTSFDVVALVRRLSGERRVGHAGTLDPLATGVLPVFLGRGTRLVEFLMEGRKTYRAAIQLGITTDTYDITGTVVSRSDPSGVSREQLESVLVAFRGEIMQTPPAFSAVKHHGIPLHRLARAGVAVVPRQRLTTVYRLDLIDFTPPLATIEVECSKGTYVRSIAHEVGQALGCGAALESLSRLRYGPFEQRDAIPLPRLTAAFRHGYWTRYLHPIDAVLYGWSALLVGGKTEDAVVSGKPVAAGGSAGLPGGSHCRVYTASGNFLGIARLSAESSLWQPHKVFPLLQAPACDPG